MIRPIRKQNLRSLVSSIISVVHDSSLRSSVIRRSSVVLIVRLVLADCSLRPSVVR
eukprot:IDg12003t1